MERLSKREKILLYILLIVAIVAGGFYFLIQSAMSSSDELDSTIEQQELIKSDMEITIASLDATNKNIKEYQKEAKEYKESFLSNMTSDDLDRYVTGLLMDNGLTAEALSIGDQIVKTSDENESNDKTDEENVEFSYVSRRRVNVIASGTVDEFVSLSQQVSKTNGIRITTCNVNRKNASVFTENAGVFSMNIEFEVAEYEQPGIVS